MTILLLRCKQHFKHFSSSPRLSFFFLRSLKTSIVFDVVLYSSKIHLTDVRFSRLWTSTWFIWYRIFLVTMMNTGLLLIYLFLSTFSYSVQPMSIDDFHCKIPTCRDFYFVSESLSQCRKWNSFDLGFERLSSSTRIRENLF